MTTNNNLEIRSDLTDISNTVKHFYILSNYFEKRRRKFERLWHSNDEGFISSIYLTKDADFIGIVERLYQIGISSAGALAEQLPLINEIEVYPKIKDYIDTIEAYRKNWKKRDIKLIKKCEKIILQRTYKLNYWNIEEMLKMHKDTLMSLENIEGDLNTIRNSKRYKIENIINIEETLKNKKKITDKQNEDYKKYEYKCKDEIYIPGPPSLNRNFIVLLNGKETKIKDANFLLLLRFVVELKKGKGGKVHLTDLEKDKIIPSRIYYQYINRLNDDLKINVMFCKDDKKHLIESLGASYYRISTHPDFVTFNLDNLLDYPDDNRIRDLAKRLEKIEKNL